MYIVHIFLRNARACYRVSMKSADLKKFKLPDAPGVYFFLGKLPPPRLAGTPPRAGGDKILYIGKATSLKDRVKSYFGKDLIETRGPHILDMVFKSGSIKWQETDSVLEALILEANLIKKYKPYYNTKEKDDKSWNYVCITNETLPRVIVERGKNIFTEASQSTPWRRLGKTKQEKFSAVYGPFTNGGALKEALRIIRRIFPFIDASSSKKQNYQFYRQLGLAPVIPASEPESKSESIERGYRIKSGMTEGLGQYKNNIKNLKLFFEGKKARILSSLKKEMLAHARRREFEVANEIKKTIFALEHIRDVSLIKEENLEEGRIRKFRIEAYDIAHMSGQNMVGVMTVVSNGIADTNEYRKFIIRTQKNSNDVGALEEMLSRRFRHSEWGMPDLVVVDGSAAQKNVAGRVLKRYQLKIPVVALVKNDRHKPERILGFSAVSSRPGLGLKKGPAFSRPLERAILLANAEAHRFGIAFHKKKRSKKFLGK